MIAGSNLNEGILFLPIIKDLPKICGQGRKEVVPTTYTPSKASAIGGLIKIAFWSILEMLSQHN